MEISVSDAKNRLSSLILDVEKATVTPLSAATNLWSRRS